jgi:hypothetical protein
MTAMTDVAALFVQAGGVYSNLPGVDPWTEERDARLYDGPHPVVAHPPCARWSRLAGFTEARFGYRRGDDGGCFASALASVRRFGGILEHPADSRAFHHFALPIPGRAGGWTTTLWDGGWTCYVEQGRYGFPVRKATPTAPSPGHERPPDARASHRLATSAESTGGATNGPPATKSRPLSLHPRFATCCSQSHGARARDQRPPRTPMRAADREYVRELIRRESNTARDAILAELYSETGELRDELAQAVADIDRRITEVHERALRELTRLTERNHPA